MTQTSPQDGPTTNPKKPLRLDTGDDLDAVVAEHDVVLVDFYTKGCAVCQSIEPIIGNVARVTDAVVAMVNPGNDLRLVEEYNVRSVPTLLLFKDGELVDRLDDGFQDTQTLVDFVEQYTA